MSDHDSPASGGSDEEFAAEMFRRAQEKQQSSNMNNKKSNNAKKNNKQKNKKEEAEEEADADVASPSAASASKSNNNSNSQPLTQYDKWKAQKTKPAKGKDADSEDEDESASSKNNTGHHNKGGRNAPKQQQQQVSERQQQREQAAQQPRQPREPKATRVPIKVERAKATRQADIDSGVAGALRELAIKKQQKKMKKKAKKLAAQDDEDEEEEEEDDEEEDDNRTDSEKEDENTRSKAGDAAADGQDDSGAEEVEEDEADEAADEIDEEEPEEGSAAYRELNSIHVVSLDESVITSAALDEDEMLFPVTSFSALDEEFGLDSRLVQAATEGFVKPSPIQAQCWPILFGGKDVIGVAHTGSGKSLAFLLPAVFYIIQVRDREEKKAAKTGIPLPVLAAGEARTPRVLILAPTRELAIQTSKVSVDICTKLFNLCSSSSSSSSSTSSALSTQITNCAVYGGSSVESQSTSIQSVASLDILVATPGRLLGHLESNTLNLSKVGYLVLDEADRMLDLGFEQELKTICEHIPANRQTCLFSATWEANAQKASESFLKRGPEKTIKVVVGSEDLTAAKTVKQIVEVIDRRQGKREKRLLDLLDEYAGPSRANRILIFVLYKKEAGLLAEHLHRKGWKASAISGDRTQAQRMEALEKFRSGEVPLLVATDVAARGLDVKGVSVVINFSLGLSVEQYIHRVGRCGRAGANGIAHTFIVDYDAPHTPALIKVLEENGQTEIEPDLREMADRAARQAAKHTEDPTAGLKGDAYFASLKKGAITKNVNLAKQLAKEAEEAEIEAKIFGEDADEGVVQKGKKQHAIHHQKGRSKAGASGGGHGGQRKGKSGKGH